MLKPLTKEGMFECGLLDIEPMKLRALVPVPMHDAIGLGLAIANEAGYYPVPLFWCHADTFDEAYKHAEELNQELFGMDFDAATAVINSSMIATRVQKAKGWRS